MLSILCRENLQDLFDFKSNDDNKKVKKNRMLNMTNQFESYQRSSLLSSVAPSCSADIAAAAAAKADRESIHSGQFMVSHFEAEEAQDDLEDSEVKMIDPEDPSLSKPDEPIPCMEVQLYVPRKVTHFQKGGVGGSHTAVGLITSHLEIETSLTKLFKCMNLAYSQKLTSPKWNHFKGVRLRWKDKIRLNNVIWRCWHMQFILKRKTPVCQFASPLDVDIHSNPQSVVLEGKYWKRKLDVIKAEYRKWRRNFKTQATGCLTYDTKSELDFLEWSPSNDRNLMLLDDWTSDTLFSAINVPFPFPDPREIARGAALADFIQPSLGPLQPNLDDIDLTFAELLQSSRLPPVPEEGTDEMLRNVDYGFSAIMGSEQMDSNIIDVSNTSNNNPMQGSNDDANMLELNTPLNNMQFADIEQQFAVRGNANVTLISGAQAINSYDAIMNEGRGTSTNQSDVVANRGAQTKHYATDNSSLSRQNSNEFPGKSVIKGRIAKNFQRPFRREPHNYDKAQPTLHQTTVYQQMLAEQQKTQHHQQHLQQPSMTTNALQHQVSSYQPQPQQQLQYSSQFSHASLPSVLAGSNNNYGYSSVEATTSNKMQNLLQPNKSFDMLQSSLGVPVVTQPSSTSASLPMLNVKIEPPSTDVLSMFNLSSTNELYGNSNTNSISYKPYPSGVPSFKKSASTGNYINMRSNVNQSYIQEQPQTATSTTHPQMHTQSLPMTLTGQQLPSLSNALQRQSQPQSHTHVQTQLSPTSSQHQQQHIQQHLAHQQQQQQRTAQAQQQQQHVIMPKEMFRSNSLPLNVSLQKLDARFSHDPNFAVPKYHAKSSKSRSRSNSIHQHMVAPSSSSGNGGSSSGLLMSQQLQAATSDPMLNSTLAQLLTTNSRLTTLGKQQSSSTSAISTVPMTSLPMQGGTPNTTPASKITTVTVTVPSIFMSPTLSSTVSSSLLGATSSHGKSEVMQRQQTQVQQQQQQQKQPQQKSPKKSTSLPAPASPLMVHSPPNPKMLSFPLSASSQAGSCTSHLSLSPDSFHDQDSPLSPTHSLKYPRDNQRRAGHIHAEQKRRYNIKNGFDMLHSLIPQLQQNPNAKLSKAAMLQKGADHIKHLRSERNLLKDKMEALRQERDALNNSLTHLQSILPANGAPVTRQGTEHVRQLYEQYVRYRTMNNWKFWILGLILEPLLTSYTSSVSSASMEELRRTAFLWVDQHCSLIDLRPAVSNKLKYLSMKTDILSDPPSTLQEEVSKSVHNTTGQHPNLHGT